MGPDPSVRVLYRAVHHNPPTLDDFRSYEELGIPFKYRPSVEARRRWSGLSMEDDWEDLASTARERPSIGRFIAELHIPADMRVTIEQTGRPHHFTVWGEARELLGTVTAVIPVVSRLS